jgi:hypothetical protein
MPVLYHVCQGLEDGSLPHIIEVPHDDMFVSFWVYQGDEALDTLVARQLDRQLPSC